MLLEPTLRVIVCPASIVPLPAVMSIDRLPLRDDQRIIPLVDCRRTISCSMDTVSFPVLTVSDRFL